ncbi:MAG: helix-turn-helix domain-containing protein [Blastocatellia bacterium]
MSAQQDERFYESSIDELAADVAAILQQRLKPKELLSLFQIVFLEVPEVAGLLRVEVKTVQQWVSSAKIPYRKANGHVIFLLAEILAWTLPPDDKQSKHRLTLPKGCRLVKPNLAAIREREK